MARLYIFFNFAATNHIKNDSHEETIYTIFGYGLHSHLKCPMG